METKINFDSVQYFHSVHLNCQHSDIYSFEMSHSSVTENDFTQLEVALGNFLLLSLHSLLFAYYGSLIVDFLSSHQAILFMVKCVGSEA